MAQLFPDSTDVEALETLDNVRLEGPQPYQAMPTYLRRFDVCVIPFHSNDLTDCVDPVKLYEYLTWGKPVVAMRIAELERLSDLISVLSGESCANGR